MSGAVAAGSRPFDWLMRAGRLSRRCRRAALLLLLAPWLAGWAAAQPAPAAEPAAPMSEQAVDAWLLRLHDASRQRSFIGTFVVSSAAGALASARIWHACEGDQQIERVETLTGTARSVFRHNDRVVTFLPEQRVARTEQRDALGAFPGLLKSLDTTITDFYSARPFGHARVAGFDTDIVQLTPKDGWRFGYRVWSERASALVLKVQTLGTDGGVLEQAAFSELQLDAPVRLEALAKMMDATDGWTVERPTFSKTSAAAMGWTLADAPPGFKPVQCYERMLGLPSAAAQQQSGAAVAGASAMHCVYSDGLASASLFVEPYVASRHRTPGQMTMGATHTLTRRIGGQGAAPLAGPDADGGWWLTAVGEVPLQTLQLFGQQLRRTEPRGR